MSDPIPGIKYVPPTYPVRPTQPSQKDREPGDQRKKRRQPDDEPRSNDDDSGDKPTIDELV